MSRPLEPWMTAPMPERDLPGFVRNLRWPLTAAAILLSFLSWVTTPLHASLADYRRDEAAGRVAQVSQLCGAQYAEFRLYIRVGAAPSGPTPDLCWTNETGLTYAADLSRRQAARVFPDLPEEWERSGLSELTASDVHDASNGLAVVLLLGLAIGLVNGPQPRRLTKWGTFWFLLIPGGLGVAWLLGNEAPWNRRLQQLPAPPPHWRGPVGGGALVRHGGWTGFLGLLIAAFLVGLLSSAIRAALSPADDGALISSAGAPAPASAADLAQRQVVDEDAAFLGAGPLLHVRQIHRSPTGDRAVGP